MKVLITGAGGQLGAALRRFAPRDIETVAVTHSELDIADITSVHGALRDGVDAVINAAAYTDVEGAEKDPAAAYRINSEGVAILAAACAARGVRLVHVSTDFVFDGTKSTPYQPTDIPRPLNVYGASKREGERRLLEILPDACVMRTSWLHSAQGANFVTKLLQRMIDQAPLRVVVDEVGTPTCVHSLAAALWRAIERRTRGIHHWSDGGSTNRHEYAQMIGAIAAELGLIDAAPAIAEARAADFAGGARRPAYSVMATETTQAALGMQPPSWQEGLRLTMEDLRQIRTEAPAE
jgi:dTDP-4-dehydrorhamnose reductase